MQNTTLNQYRMPRVIAKAVKHINSHNKEGIKRVFMKTGASLHPSGDYDEVFAAHISKVCRL